MLHMVTISRPSSYGGQNWSMASNRWIWTVTMIRPYGCPPFHQGTGTLSRYLELIVREILPRVRQKIPSWILWYFLWKRRLYSWWVATARLGNGLPIHADRIYRREGGRSSWARRATSAEHLMVATDEGIRKDGRSQDIGNLCQHQLASVWWIPMPARKMLEAGMTTWPPTLIRAQQLTCSSSAVGLLYVWTPVEVLNASVNVKDKIGTACAGKRGGHYHSWYLSIDYPLYFLVPRPSVYKERKTGVVRKEVYKNDRIFGLSLVLGESFPQNFSLAILPPSLL